MRFLLLILLTSCEAPSEVYAKADRATFDAIAPEYRAYVMGDPTLTQEQRDRRFRTLDAWLLRLGSSTKRLAPTR